MDVEHQDQPLEDHFDLDVGDIHVPMPMLRSWLLVARAFLIPFCGLAKHQSGHERYPLRRAARDIDQVRIDHRVSKQTVTLQAIDLAKRDNLVSFLGKEFVIAYEASRCVH